jgi:hypothetical protein
MSSSPFAPERFPWHAGDAYPESWRYGLRTTSSATLVEGTVGSWKRRLAILNPDYELVGGTLSPRY